MLLAIDWLKQFVTVSHTPDELAKIMVSLGFEVEEIKDNVLDLEITPNRGDCLSIWGLAREYAAKTIRRPADKKVKLPQLFSFDKIAKNPAYRRGRPGSFEIEFEKPALCDRYSALVIRDVAVKPSSPAIQNRLKQMGQEPINNLVDITNLVMFELGLPLHAFDLDKIQGAKMRLRSAQEKPGSEESLVTLDGQLRKLAPGALVFEDKNRLIDLAGIMGGENSAISAETKNILLQAAVFPAKTIRRTSKLMGMATEASYRYEREVDQNFTLISLARAAELIKQEAGGTILGVIDRQNKTRTCPKIELDFSQIEKLTGTKISPTLAQDILQRLGLKKSAGGRTGSSWQTPSWRHDLNFPQDLIEEIIRIYGYDKLKKLPVAKTQPLHPAQEKDYQKILGIKKQLTSNGWNEIQTYSFISEKEFQAIGAPKNLLKPSTPVSDEYKYLRSTLLPGLLKTLSLNRWCWPEGLRIFEIGTVFTPQEKIKLAQASYFQKDVLRGQAIDPSHPLAKLYKIKKTVWFEEKSLDLCPPAQNDQLIIQLPVQIKQPSNFPPHTRDLAVVVNKNVSAETIQKTILKSDDRIILAELFDEFESDRLGKNNKNLAFHLVFNQIQQTIAAPEADKIMEKIIKKLAAGFKAELRK